MRILIVSQYFWPENFRINDISTALVEKGHDVTVLTGQPNYPSGEYFKGYGFFGPSRENYKGVKVLRVPLIPRGKNKGIFLALNYLSYLIFATLMGPFLCGRKFDKIFVYQLSPVTSAIPAIPIKILSKAKMYMWVTDLWPETLEATGVVKSRWALNLWGKLVKFIYDKSDVILVTSKGFIEKISSRGVSLDKIKYWPQWGEELFLEPLEETSPNVEECVLKENFNIVFAGNIGTSQSFETIIDAATELKNYEDIKWIILGDGLQKTWVEKKIEENKLEKTVYMLGRKPIEEVPKYFQYSKVLLASLKKDPLFSITVPAKVQAYLASGKPILISMDGEGAQLVKDANAGVACSAGDAKGLAKGALELYDMSEEEREVLGENARVFFKHKFTRKNLLSELENIMGLS